MEKRKREFIYMKQGRSTVSEYGREFIRICKYAREMISIAEAKCKRFEQRLNTKIRMFLVALQIRDLNRLAC